MNSTDQEYFRLLKLILDEGRVKKNRTGVDTIGIFGAQARFNLQEGFPVLTTKKVFLKGVIHELLWFIKGDTNIKYLVDNGVHIWDDWIYKKYKDALAKRPGNTFEVNSTGDLGGNRWHFWTKERFIQEIKDNQNFATLWGDLGEGTYGGMWRAFPYWERSYIDPQVEYVDQLQKVIDKLKTNPDDRRMIVSAWHPYWVDHCALPPCHCLFHFNTEELTLKERWGLYVKSNKQLGIKNTWSLESPGLEENLNMIGIPKRCLNLLLYQRSCDTFLGVPFNITSYSLLLAMVAHCVGMAPGTFVHTYGDLHIYSNHLEQVNLQLSRASYGSPTLWLNPEVRNLFDFKFEDIRIDNYKSHSAIHGDIAV